MRLYDTYRNGNGNQASQQKYTHKRCFNRVDRQAAWSPFKFMDLMEGIFFRPKCLYPVYNKTSHVT